MLKINNSFICSGILLVLCSLANCQCGRKEVAKQSLNPYVTNVFLMPLTISKTNKSYNIDEINNLIAYQKELNVSIIADFGLVVFDYCNDLGVLVDILLQLVFKEHMFGVSWLALKVDMALLKSIYPLTQLDGFSAQVILTILTNYVQSELSINTNLDITGERTLETARQMVDWGWFESIDDAFQNAYQIQGSLAPEFALQLVKAGKYNSVEEAMGEAIQLALTESSNYVLEKKNKYIAFWEGICHGWAVASGLVPRPRHTVKFPGLKNAM